MEKWNELMNRYSQICNSDKLLAEWKWLNEKYSQICLETDSYWIDYSDKEKQLKRIKASIQFKKTKRYDDGIFRLEECVIDLYETIETCLFKLNSFPSDLLDIRLKAYLLLIKKTINCYRDIRAVKDCYLSELRQVIIDCLNSDREDYFIDNVNVLYLDSKAEIVQRLIFSSPQRP